MLPKYLDAAVDTGIQFGEIAATYQKLKLHPSKRGREPVRVDLPFK
jgi:hypothetical protein